MEQPVGSKYVRVNSRFRMSGDCSNFTLQFCNAEMQQVSSVALISFSMNRLYTNIQTINNTLLFTTNDGIKTFTIPPAQYNIELLVEALNKSFGEDDLVAQIAEIGTTVTIKITIVYNPNVDRRNTFRFQPLQSTASRVLGLLEPFELDNGSQNKLSYTSPFPPSLNSPGLLLNSSLVDNSTLQPVCTDSNVTTTALLAKIVTAYDTSYGSHIVYEPRNPIVHDFTLSCRAKSAVNINFFFTDLYFSPITIPDGCFCDLVLKVNYLH